MMASGNNSQGVRLFQQGHYQAAMHEFQQALQADPENADAYYNIARTYHQIGLQQQDDAIKKQAEDLYNQCLDRDPNHVDCHRGLAVLLSQRGRPDASKRLLENWAMREEKSADARIELARLLQEQGDPEAARIRLLEAVNMDGSNARAWAALGHLREQSARTMDDYAQAMSNYQRSYSRNNLQPRVAERIRHLNHVLSGGAFGAAPSGNTRTVTNPTLPVR